MKDGNLPADDIFLSIIIPAYNEEAVISDTLHQILNYISKLDFKSEIVVVDDGSIDKTLALAKSLLVPPDKVISYKTNCGKGHAVLTGFRNARGKVWLFMDADLSTKLAEIKNFLDTMEEADILIGSRRHKKSIISLPQKLPRIIIGACGNFFIRKFLNLPFFDTQCGFKMFKASAGRKLIEKAKIKGWTFDVELLYIAKKNGMSIKELPVNWQNKSGTKFRMVGDSLKTFIEVIKIKFYHLLGRYN